MADIAMAFHWTPETMERMDLDDLVRWHALASARLEALLGATQPGQRR